MHARIRFGCRNMYGGPTSMNNFFHEELQLLNYVQNIGLAKWITPEDNPPFGLNTLKLEDIRESANYTCEAASVLGVIETMAEVKVQCKYNYITIYLSSSSSSAYRCALLDKSHIRRRTVKSRRFKSAQVTLTLKKM